MGISYDFSNIATLNHNMEVRERVLEKRERALAERYGRLYGAGKAVIENIEQRKKPISDVQQSFLFKRLVGISPEVCERIFKRGLGVSINGRMDIRTTINTLSWHEAIKLISYVRSPKFNQDLRDEGGCRDMWSDI